MADALTLETLRDLVAGDAVAIRRVQRLQPAGGPGDKVFPPTYEGGTYAEEERIIDGQQVHCVLLDSVQSQANRMEQALKEAFYRGPGQEADLPVITVDFAAAGLPEIGEVTSLDAPHRLADAILRDSLLDGQPFPKTSIGQVLRKASLYNATGLYEVCPTALIFGVWDSTGESGGLGVKFQRMLVSEMVAIDARSGVKPHSRIDPLGIELAGTKIYRASDAVRERTGLVWTLDVQEAAIENGKPVEIKPAELNHGNVTPSLKSQDRSSNDHGGVTFRNAMQFVVFSLPAIRRLRFPTDRNEYRTDRDVAARTALAALALAAADLSIRKGCDLRSRCLLVPTHPADWEVVAFDGSIRQMALPDPRALFLEASRDARRFGLPSWQRLPWVMRPSERLQQLVRSNSPKGKQASATE
jgi:CRISPR-associated protein Csb1